MAKEQAKTQLGLPTILGYAAGSLITLFGLVALFTNFLGGLLVIIAGLLLLPFTYHKFIEPKLSLTRAVRIVGALILLFLGLAIVSASALSKATIPSAVIQTNTTTTPVTTVSVPHFLMAGEKLNLGDNLYITLESFETSITVDELGSGFSTTHASEGAIFLIFNAKFENEGKENQLISPDFIVKDEQNRKFSVAGGVVDSRGEYFDTNLNPGLTRSRMRYYIEVPNMTKQLTIAVKDTMFTSEKGTYQINITALNISQ